MYFSTLPFVSDLKLSFDSFRLKKRHIGYKDIGKYVNRRKRWNILLSEFFIYLIAGIRKD